MSATRLKPAAIRTLAISGLAITIAGLAGCSGSDEADAGVVAKCDSEAAVPLLRQHLLQAAASTQGNNPAYDELANILSLAGSYSEPDLQSSFQQALQGLQRIFAEDSFDPESLVISAAEIVERGTEEGGGLLCWARIDASTPPSSEQAIANLNGLMAAQYGWQSSSLPQRATVELFYTIQTDPRPSITESDLSAKDALAVRHIAQLAQIAPIFLVPFEASKQAEQARERELSAAQERLTNANLSEARLNFSQAEAALNAAWENLSESSRAQLLPQQRQWLRSRDAYCELQGRQYSSDSRESEIVKLRCMTEEDLSRTSELPRSKGK